MNTAAAPVTADARQLTLERLEDQIRWYDGKSAYNRRWHMRLKVATLISASLVPLAAGLVASVPFIAGGLGVMVVVFEGVQQLYQFHTNWVTYRGTCEALRHEKYLFLATAGPYETAARPVSLLAERVESLVSTEHSKWVSQQEQASKGREPKG